MADVHGSEPARWLDDANHVAKVYRWLWTVCVTLLLGGEALLMWARGRAAEHADHHAGFAFESWPGFYALFGFVACVTLVIAAKELRKVLMRPEDYYEPVGSQDATGPSEREDDPNRDGANRDGANRDGAKRDNAGGDDANGH